MYSIVDSDPASVACAPCGGRGYLGDGYDCECGGTGEDFIDFSPLATLAHNTKTAAAAAIWDRLDAVRSALGDWDWNELARNADDDTAAALRSVARIGFLLNPTKCSACPSPATRRDAFDVADVCDEHGEASDDQKRDREKRQRRMAEREEI